MPINSLVPICIYECYEECLQPKILSFHRCYCRRSMESMVSLLTVSERRQMPRKIKTTMHPSIFSYPNCPSRRKKSTTTNKGKQRKCKNKRVWLQKLSSFPYKQSASVFCGSGYTFIQLVLKGTQIFFSTIIKFKSNAYFRLVSSYLAI